MSLLIAPTLGEYVAGCVAASLARSAVPALEWVPVLIEPGDPRLRELEVEIGDWERLAEHFPAAEELHAKVAARVARAAGDALERRHTVLWLHRMLHRARRRPGRSERSFVAALNDEFVWAALRLADVRGHPLQLFDGWRELAGWLRRRPLTSLAVVAHPRAFTPGVLRTMAELGGRAGGAGSLGLITARSVTGITWLLAKLIFYERISFGPPTSIIPAAVASGGTGVLGWEDLTAERLQQLLKECPASLCLAMHGDNIDGDLREGVLCGKPSQGSVSTLRSDDKVHTCLHTDFCRRDVAGALMRVPVDQIRSRILFSEACSGVSVEGGVFPAELSLALGALEGQAGAFLSSVKVVRGTTLGPLFVTALLRAGYPFGEVARIFSLLHQAATGDVPSFLLLGDPGARLAPELAVRTVRLPWPSSCGLDLHLEDLTDPLVRIELVSGADPGALRAELAMTSPDEGRAPVFSAAIPELDGIPLTLFLFSPQPFAEGRLDLRFADETGEWDRLQADGRRIEGRLTFLGRMADKIRRVDGLRDTSAIRRQAADLMAVVEEAHSAMRPVRALLGASRPVLRRIDGPNEVKWVWTHLLQQMTRLDATLAAAWPSWRMTHHVAPFYNGILFACGAERPTGRCYICGNDTFEVNMESPTQEGFSRTVTHCLRCAVISDRPADESLAEIRGIDHCRPGERVEQEVYIANSTDAAKTHSASLSFEGELPWFSYEVLPTDCIWVSPPGAGAAVRFSIKMKAACLPGVYHLSALTVSHLGLNVSTKPFRVAGEASRDT